MKRVPLGNGWPKTATLLPRSAAIGNRKARRAIQRIDVSTSSPTSVLANNSSTTVRRLIVQDGGPAARRRSTATKSRPARRRRRRRYISDVDGMHRFSTDYRPHPRWRASPSLLCSSVRIVDHLVARVTISHHQVGPLGSLRLN